VTVNNRAAIERVLEKTLEETQRDLAAFLKARADAPSLDPKQNGGRDREQPREPDQNARARLDQAIREGEASEAGRRASRMDALDISRQAAPRLDPTPSSRLDTLPPRVEPQPRPEAAPRREPPPLLPQRNPRPAMPAAVTPQAFATPGLVRNQTSGDAAPAASAGIPSAVTGLMQVEADRLRGTVAIPPVAQPAGSEPSMAERVIAERRPIGDWPPIPADMRAMAPVPFAFPQGLGGPRLSATVPRKVQDRIDEYYRTGFLRTEPFRFEPIDPVPVPGRMGTMMRSGLGAMGPGDVGRPPPEPPRLTLVPDTRSAP
jgi:hypothetical protein